MTKAFSSIRIVNSTHVLAGPFASYQLGILGAEVIKVKSPHNPDQARMQGADRALNDSGMGTSFMAQASGKKAIALDLKSEGGRQALLRMLETADVFVQNFRPGSFDRLGLSYEDVRKLNPRLIYCSISAFGATGPRREETGYDNVIQASSGMMAMTGHGDGRPLKSGAQLVDYGTGFAAAFAISAALFQREKTGVGQFIDVSMFDVALMLCSSHVAGLTWTGSVPKAKGNRFPFATIGCYRASDTDIMIAASNLSQQRRLWIALGRRIWSRQTITSASMPTRWRKRFSAASLRRGPRQSGKHCYGSIAFRPPVSVLSQRPLPIPRPFRVPWFRIPG